MDLMKIMRENTNACKIILAQNQAETATKYGITLADAKKLHNFAALVLMKEVAE